MKIGVALGGGGAKGYAHIGALSVFKAEGVSFEVVTGTSVGALVGAAYAAGSISELISKAKDISLFDIPWLLDVTISPLGLFKADRGLKLLESLLPCKNIEDLPIKFAAQTVDLITGKSVLIEKGNILDAVRASIAIPSLITPVFTDGACLVDGGLLEPVPVQAARQLGADYVVAIDLFGNDAPSPKVELQGPNESSKSLASFITKPAKTLKATIESISDKISSPTELRSVIAIIERTLTLNQRTLTTVRLKEYPPNAILQPPVHDIGLLDFHKSELGFICGVEAARDSLDKIKKELKL